MILKLYSGVNWLSSLFPSINVGGIQDNEEAIRRVILLANSQISISAMRLRQSIQKCSGCGRVL